MNLPDRPLAALPRWGAAALLIATMLARWKRTILRMRQI